MTAEIRFFWARLNANYWFYPATFAILGVLLAFGTIYLDRNGFADFLNKAEWLVPVRPTGASDILTVMASAMIGVASTVFSITIVAVSYASGTYGPRLLTNFLEDKGNQVSLATFIGTFVYALVVLRSVRADGEMPDDTALGALPGFAPQLSLLVAYILMAACVGVLVFFLNHVPSSIRINKVLQVIGERLIGVVRETYPVEDSFTDAREGEGGESIAAWTAGYIQMIDFEDLQQKAKEHECVLSLRVRTGDFVHPGLAMINVNGADVGELAEIVREDFTIGPFRTPEQDAQFLIDELVEIGLRALSPGINDPFTAITALHWLGAAISEIGRRDLRKDVGGTDAEERRVIPLADTFEHYVGRGFGSIRGAVASSPNAALIMLEVLENAAVPIIHDKRKQLLREQGTFLMEQVETELSGPDLERVRQRHEKFNRSFFAED